MRPPRKHFKAENGEREKGEAKISELKTISRSIAKMTAQGPVKRTKFLRHAPNGIVADSLSILS